MSLPVVSVIIPCFGQAEYLAESVRSVVDQTFGDWEIVIVDDGSPDDVLLPEMLERTVGLLESEPDVAVAYTDYERFGAEQGRVETGRWTVEQLCYSCPLSNTSLYRREVWSVVGGYNPNMRHGYEDWDFWIGAAERGFTGRRVPEAMWKYRKAQESRNVGAIRRERDILDQIARNHPRLFTRKRRARNWVRRNLELFPGRARYWSRRLFDGLRRRLPESGNGDR